MSTVRIRGLDGIDKALNKLANETRASVLVDALEDSGRPIEREYAAGAPPFISGGVRTRVLESAPRRARIAIGTKHPLAHIFEFGTKRRRTTGSGKVQKKPAYRGRIHKIGFGRRAFDTNVDAWFRDIGRRIWKRVERVGR